jgi:hypothetical protein
MKRIIKLKTSELIRIVEDSMKFMYNPESLPQVVSDLEKLIDGGKKSIYNVYNVVFNTTISDICENMDYYIQTVEKFRANQKILKNKWEKYFDVMESFFDDHLNDNLDAKAETFYSKANDLLTDLDTLQLDMDDLNDILQDLIDVSEKQIRNGYDKRYSGRIINID